MVRAYKQNNKNQPKTPKKSCRPADFRQIWQITSGGSIPSMSCIVFLSGNIHYFSVQWTPFVYFEPASSWAITHILQYSFYYSYCAYYCHRLIGNWDLDTECSQRDMLAVLVPAAAWINWQAFLHSLFCHLRTESISMLPLSALKTTILSPCFETKHRDGLSAVCSVPSWYLPY